MAWVPSSQAAVQALLKLHGVSIVLDTPLSPFRMQGYASEILGPLPVIVGFLLIYILAVVWGGQVTEIVPQPYLDEIFHIPQAQSYCSGNYDYYDPKLTTPPGLYAFAILFSKAWFNCKCQVFDLRLFNIMALLVSMAYACDCRTLITRIWTRDPAAPLANSELKSRVISNWLKNMSYETLHTAINIALFPPLFFFSGLFYTDILSTCLVLRAYRLFLERKGAYKNSPEGLTTLYLTGMIALTMRQTNIFWVAIFLGGLELVRIINPQVPSENSGVQVPQSWQKTIVSRFGDYTQGQIHDMPLRDASLLDFILCPVSIVVAAIWRPLLLVTRLWPYIALLVSFAGFVVWNGGVVLGDKSNHVATIHLPQMLYIWPLITFFSVPLIVPVGVSFLQDLLSLLRLPLFPRLVWNYLLVVASAFVALAATILIIKYNTIIHPFTLADNRHYMFYVFRYTILRHPLVRYLLAPVYLACAYVVYLTLCGPSKTPEPKLSHEKRAEELSRPIPTRNAARPKQEGPKLSFILILLVTTALSLITAPLVEPRYFITPWVIWRLNVPPLNPDPKSVLGVSPGAPTMRQDLGFAARLWDDLKTHDYRLWLETAWFLLINVITGYFFLYRGFEWKQEPGKIQRFMW